MIENNDYPYRILTSWAEAEELEPGAVVIDSDGDVLTLRDFTQAGRRWVGAGTPWGYRTVSVPAIVLVHGFGPDDYPEDWEAMGGEQR